MTSSGQHFQKLPSHLKQTTKSAQARPLFTSWNLSPAALLLVCSTSVTGIALKFSKYVQYVPQNLCTLSCPTCIHKWFPGLQILTRMSPFQSELHSYFYAKCDLSTSCLYPFSALFSCGGLLWVGLLPHKKYLDILSLQCL